MQTHRVVFPKPGVVEVQEFDVASPGPDEVLIRTEVSLISPGTEGAGLMDRPNTGGKFPKRPGYSNVGVVEEVGANVKAFAPGDRVASHAGHGDRVVVSVDRGVVRVPEGVKSEHAAFSSLAAISLQAVRKARVELGESVLVVGQGLVGNLALQLARLQGGCPVIAADLDERRLVFSRKVEADGTIDMEKEDLVAATQAFTGGEGAQVVIEATGEPEPIVPAFQAAAWCGRVVLLGSTRGETERVNFYQDVHKRGLTILGAHNAVRPKAERSAGFWPVEEDVRLVLELMAGGRLQVAPLLTTRLPAYDASEGYRLIMEKKRDALGILLDWRETV